MPNWAPYYMNQSMQEKCLTEHLTIWIKVCKKSAVARPSAMAVLVLAKCYTSFYLKIFMWWVRHWQVSCPIRKEVLLLSQMIPLSLYFSFDGRVVAKLPFVPISLLQGISHRNLAGEDYTDCSFIFLYILCTMSIRQVNVTHYVCCIVLLFKK